MYSEHTQFPTAIKDKKLDHLDLSGDSKKGWEPRWTRRSQSREKAVWLKAGKGRRSGGSRADQGP